MSVPVIYVGCAGWSLPPHEKHRFPEDGSHLARYAGCFSAVEINSSFYQAHRPETYARWAASVPAEFRFSVKFPKVITHERRLKNVRKTLTPFIESVAELGDKLGALLLQLPPSFEFERRRAAAFFKLLRGMHTGTVVLEPRHATWFHAKAVDLCKSFGIGYVVADPAPVEGADALEEWTDVVYFRLHGSPRMYFSSYSAEYLESLAARLNEVAARGIPVWCIFDNTGMGTATGNACDLVDNLAARSKVSAKSRRKVTRKRK